MTRTCALCGYEFTDAEMVAKSCPACVLNPGGCGLVKCPACDYEWPDEQRSRVAGFFRKLFGKGGSRS